MIVTATVPGPGVDSCANARSAPTIPTAAMSTAIHRVMTDLLFVCITLLLSRAAAAQTIGQECDSSVALASDEAAHRRYDEDLVLLDDAGIGHADRRESRTIWSETGR